MFQQNLVVGGGHIFAALEVATDFSPTTCSGARLTGRAGLTAASWCPSPTGPPMTSSRASPDGGPGSGRARTPGAPGCGVTAPPGATRTGCPGSQTASGPPGGRRCMWRSTIPGDSGNGTMICGHMDIFAKNSCLYYNHLKNHSKPALSMSLSLSQSTSSKSTELVLKCSQMVSMRPALATLAASPSSSSCFLAASRFSSLASI